ncbi:MAG: M14 family zinc carboxypeptidase [Chloroflexota bacterium]|nr:L,D-transpeptidase family protein [Chloroflexota bacterium]
MKLEITFDLNLKWLRIIAAFLVLATLLPAFSTSNSYAAPYTTEFIGNSVQGRPIVAYRFGQGPTHIAFIGGIHQGSESNATDLIFKAIAYYTDKPNEIPTGLTVYFIPNFNPDGRELKQRTNARGVDLNRNWPTQDWKQDTYDVEGLVKGGGGPKPFSEPETDALWKYIQSNDIISAIIYHSKGGNVIDSLPTAAGQRYATNLARTLAYVTGYTYLDIWGYYDISGETTDFLNSKGIYSLTVELYSYTDMDWNQNLRGFSAVISFFTPRFFNETGQSLSGRLLAYWNSNGAAKTMGNPTSDAQEQGNKLWQQFEQGTLTLDRKSGLMAWKEHGTGPVDVPLSGPPLIKPTPGLKLSGIPVPQKNKVPPVDQQSTQVRDKVNQLQQDAHDLEQLFFSLSQRISRLPNSPIIPSITAPPASDLEKEIKVVLNTNSIATIFAYEKGKLIRTFGAFSGKPGFDTPKGQFKVSLKLLLLKTNRWYEDDGTEYYLNHYLSFTNTVLAATGTPDDWAFHQMRIPVSGPDAGQMQTGPSHGCLALSPSDAEWLFNWATTGTPVAIN